MYPNTPTKPHYHASSAAAQLFLCAGTSCTCYTNVSAPFYSAAKKKKNNLQVTNACAHQGDFPFLFFVFVFKCANSQWARRKLQPVQLLKCMQTKCARAQKNICACTGHTCAHTVEYTDGRFVPDLITVRLLAKAVGAVSLSAQPVEPLMWLFNCCSSRPEVTGRRR